MEMSEAVDIINGEQGKVSESDALTVDDAADVIKEMIAEPEEENSEPESSEAEEESGKEDEPEAGRDYTAVNQELQQAKEIALAYEQTFQAQFGNVDWQSLRESNPGEFAARRGEFLDGQNQIQQLRTNIATTEQNLVKEVTHDHLKKEAKKLGGLIPEWSDGDVASKEKTELRDYLISAGIPQGQIDGKVDSNGNIIHPGLTDAVAISIARKAMLYDQQMKTKKPRTLKIPGKKKVAKPKYRNPYKQREGTVERAAQRLFNLGG